MGESLFPPPLPLSLSEKGTSRVVLMDIFDSEPRSFKMDRRCPLALELKEMVTKKLVGFLGGYSDDVLAEYIVVLVCNGKHQNQARNDLEDFLGDSSSTFVSWLWGYLSQNAETSKKIDISFEKESAGAGTELAIVKDQKKQLLHSKLEGAAVTFETSTAIPGSHVKSNLSDPNVKKIHEAHHQTRSFEQALSKNAHQKDTENDLDIERCYPNNSECGKNSVRRGNEKKISGATCVSACCEHTQPLKYHGSSSNAQVDSSSNAQVDTAGEVCARSLLAINNAAKKVHDRSDHNILHNHVAKKRGSVWDRLGRPSEEDAVEENKEILRNAVEIAKGPSLGHAGNVVGRHVLSGNRLTSRLLGEALPIENKRCTVGFQKGFQEPNSSNRMDLSMECVDKHISYEGTSISLQKKSHVPCDFPKKLKMNEIMKMPPSTSGSQISSGTTFCEMSRTPHKQREKDTLATSARTASLSKSGDCSGGSEIPPGSHSLTEREQASNGSVQSEVEDVKLRLHQIEMEMCKLRSKHSGISIKVKPHQTTDFGGNISLHREEDIESRTVFLTNVHFAATKEVLSSYFGKCGSVIKSIILTDATTGQPNGSAYIIFADKESANRALALSGTSFMSRILKIVRKSDASRSTAGQPLRPLEPAQSPPVLPFYTKPSPLGKRQYVASHLKWSRDAINESFSVVAKENEGSPARGLGAN